LGLVLLVKTVIGTVFQDARVGVGEIVLIFIGWAWDWGPGRFSSRATPFPFGFLLPFAEFSFLLGLFGLVALLSPCLQDGFGLRQIFQPELPPPDFILADQTPR